MARYSIQDDPSVIIEPRRPGFIHLGIIAVGVTLMGWLYFFLAGILVTTTNQDPLASDQKHNIKRALVSKQYEGFNVAEGTWHGVSRWWPHDTDGVVAPFWSRVAGTLADDEHAVSGAREVSDADRKLFERGKWFNVGFSLVFLCVLTAGAAWLFPAGTVPVLNLMLLCGLGALLPRAVYFHPEPLFYAFFTGTWICCLVAMLGNRWWPYAAAGLLAGLAYLTKTSVQPLMLAFAAVSVCRIGLSFLGIGHDERSPFVWYKCAGGLILLGIVFTAVIWPRLEFSKQKFGDRFHTYPSYWMWMDDFNEGYKWMGEHPDLVALNADTDKPSPMKYWDEHSAEEITTRAKDGGWAAIENGFFPKRSSQSGWDAKKPWKHLLPDRGWLLVGLTGIVLLATLMARWRGEPESASTQKFILRATAVDRTLAVGFVLLSVTGYLLAYGWYEAMGGGERLVLSLFVPLVVSLVWAGEALVSSLPAPSVWRKLYSTAHLVLLGFILFRVANLLAHPEFWETARA